MQVSVNKRFLSFIETCVSLRVRMLNVVQFVPECCSDQATNILRHAAAVGFQTVFRETALFTIHQ
jgi:hypothetical protein